MGARLTKKEQEVLNFIIDYKKSNDLQSPPTKTEICEHFGYKSLFSITRFFKDLEEKGYIQSTSSRNYDLVEDAFDNKKTIRSIPLQGEVAAGLLTEAITDQTESIELPESMLKNNVEYFALRVRGDSMIGDHIIEGDLIILERTSEIRPGAIAVAFVNGDATLKRIVINKGQVELHASNPTYKPIIVKNDPSFRVLGILKFVHRSH